MNNEWVLNGSIQLRSTVSNQIFPNIVSLYTGPPNNFFVPDFSQKVEFGSVGLLITILYLKYSFLKRSSRKMNKQ